jgi:hypothetical protein
VNRPNRAGTLETLPGEGRMPTTLQKFGGLRKEPPMSLPSASGTIPVASATAPPPVLLTLFRHIVRIPRRAKNRIEGLRLPNSGTFVLPMTIARRLARVEQPGNRSPARCLCAAESQKLCECRLFRADLLTPTGRPCSEPSQLPFGRASSAARLEPLTVFGNQ